MHWQSQLSLLLGEVACGRWADGRRWRDGDIVFASLRILGLACRALRRGLPFGAPPRTFGLFAGLLRQDPGNLVDQCAEPLLVTFKAGNGLSLPGNFLGELVQRPLASCLFLLQGLAVLCFIFCQFGYFCALLLGFIMKCSQFQPSHLQLTHRRLGVTSQVAEVGRVARQPVRLVSLQQQVQGVPQSQPVLLAQQPVELPLLFAGTVRHIALAGLQGRQLLFEPLTRPGKLVQATVHLRNGQFGTGERVRRLRAR